MRLYQSEFWFDIQKVKATWVTPRGTLYQTRYNNYVLYRESAYTKISVSDVVCFMIDNEISNPPEEIQHMIEECEI